MYRRRCCKLAPTASPISKHLVKHFLPRNLRHAYHLFAGLGRRPRPGRKFLIPAVRISRGVYPKINRSSRVVLPVVINFVAPKNGKIKGLRRTGGFIKYIIPLFSISGAEIRFKKHGSTYLLLVQCMRSYLP